MASTRVSARVAATGKSRKRWAGLTISRWSATFHKSCFGAWLMRSTLAFLAVIVLLWCRTGVAQELVHFPSLEDNGPGKPATTLDGYMFRPPAGGTNPALVFLHGCDGLFNRATGLIGRRERDWAAALTPRGYIVLMVDSFGPRNHGEMCSQRGFDRELYLKRPRDAYGALLFLQAQPFVDADRVGVIGWSQGGGALLYAIGARGLGPPAQPAHGQFRAAVAFYPASCDDRRQQGWASHIPLLVLLGAEDVWTPAVPCKIFLDGAVGRGARIEIQVYPGAYHGFDRADSPRRELPEYRTAAGIVPIIGTDPVARQDALSRVPAFLARSIMN
jgi:dienelactone hydrolase